MKIEKSNGVTDASRLIRVTIGSESEIMTLGDFSRLLANPGLFERPRPQAVAPDSQPFRPL